MERTPIHPGEILEEEFLKPLGLGVAELARGTGLSRAKVGALVRRRSQISVETAIRLGTFFGVSPANWLNLQQHYDWEMAALAGLTQRIREEVQPLRLAN